MFFDKTKLIIVSLVWGISSQVAVAANPIVTLSMGPAWATGGQTQTLDLTSDIQKTYSANNNESALISGEIFAGLQFALNDIVSLQAGLAAATTSNAAFSGNIWDDADPAFNNYSYTYQVRHTRILAKAKILVDLSFHNVKPYLSAGLGIGINQAHDFTNTPTLSQALPSPNFSSKTSASFTYSIGVGADVEFSDNWQGSVGYEFADWGNSQLGAAAGQTIGDGPQLDHLFTHGLVLGLTLSL